jgi:hypothetical protein
MKLIIVFLIGLFAAQISSGQGDDFYDRVLADFNCIHCSFIAIDVESADYTGRVIIDNGTLYALLSRGKEYDKKNYRDFVKKVLIKKEKLKLDNVFLSDAKDSLYTSGMNSIRFDILKGSKEVDEVAAKGKEEFIKHYFHKPAGALVVKDGIEDRNPVINKLFEWRIATLIDDETGYLLIDTYRSMDLSESILPTEKQ